MERRGAPCSCGEWARRRGVLWYVFGTLWMIAPEESRYAATALDFGVIGEDDPRPRMTL